MNPSGHPEPSTNTTVPDSTCDKTIAKEKTGPSSDQIHGEPPVKEQIESQTATLKGQNTDQLVMETQYDSGSHPSIPIGPAIDLHKSGLVDGKRVFNNKTPQTTDIYRISFYHVQGNDSAPITPEFKLQSIDFPGSIFHNGSNILPSSSPFIKKNHLQSGLSLTDNRYLLTMLKGCLYKERKSLEMRAKKSDQPTNNFRLVMRRFYVTLHIDFSAIMIFEDGDTQGKVSKCGHYYARPVTWCSEKDFIIELNKGLELRSDEDRVEILLDDILGMSSDERLKELVHWFGEDEA